MQKNSEKRYFFLVLVFLVLMAGANMYWVILDTRPQPIIDEYVEKTLNLADQFENLSILQYPRAMYWATLGPRTFLYQTMAAPFVIFYERSPRALLVINSIFIIILGLATYKVAQLSYNSKAGLLAVIIVSTYPLMIELGKIARPHALIPSVVMLSTLAMLLAVKYRTVSSAWLLAGSMFFAFFIHPSSLYLISGPMLAILIYTSFFRKANPIPYTGALNWLSYTLHDRYIVWGVLPSMSLFCITFATWMYLKWEQYLGLKKVGQEIFAPMFGEWDYEKTVSIVISPFYLVLLLICLFILIYVSIKRERKYKYILFILGIFAWMILISHVAFTAKAWHNFSGILPVMAIITAIGMLYLVERLKHIPTARYISQSVLFISIFIAGIQYFILSWGGITSPPVLNAIGIKHDCNPRSAFCPNPPIQGNWHIKEVLGKIFEDKACSHETCDVSFISHRPPYYSDEVYTYSMVQFFPQISKQDSEDFYPLRRLSIHRMGRGEGGPLNWLFADYSIFLTEAEGRPNKKTIPHYGYGGEYEYTVIKFILNAIETGEEYQLIYKASLPNDKIVYLVKRIANFDETARQKIKQNLALP